MRLWKSQLSMNMNSMRCLRSLVFAVLVTTVQQSTDPGDWPARPRTGPRITVRSFKLNDYNAHFDGQWQGAKVASDGNVYFFSSTHGGGKDGAGFFQFNPRTNELTLKIADVSVAVGEKNAGWGPGQTIPQGKVHSDIVEHNGWLYAVTHLADDSRRANWQGSHVFGYNIATGTFKDLGIPKPRYTGYSGISLDRTRNYLYVYLTPAFAAEYNDLRNPAHGPHIFRYDLSNPDAPEGPVDMGRCNIGIPVGADNANFVQFTDSIGNTWFTLRSDPGSLYKLPAGGAAGSYVRYAGALPQVISPMNGLAAPPNVQNERYWGWGSAIGDDKFIFTMSIAAGSGSGGIYTFDAAIAQKEPGRAFTLIRNIGATNLGMAYDDGIVYFTRQIPSGSTNIETNATQGDAGHLMSLNLATRAVADHGLIEDQSRRRPWRVESMSASNGNVFMSGDWYLLSGPGGSVAESGTHRYNPANHNYVPLARGQFFAVVKVAQKQ